MSRAEAMASSPNIIARDQPGSTDGHASDVPFPSRSVPLTSTKDVDQGGGRPWRPLPSLPHSLEQAGGDRMEVGGCEYP